MNAMFIGYVVIRLIVIEYGYKYIHAKDSQIGTQEGRRRSQMITKDEIQELLHSTETYRVERTTSTDDMDKFQEAICAFANDLSGSLKKGYLILRSYDNGGNVGGKMAVIMSPVCPQLCHKLEGDRLKVKHES